ncbi:MAG: HD domain-containing protein [Treponema sp.]|nr:HD domain-containing protein [Treponema sp.]
MAVYKPKILIIYDASAPNDFSTAEYESRYTVLEAKGFEEAWTLNELYGKEIAAIIINDNTSNFDIFALLFEFRKADMFRRIPIILLTQNMNSEFLSRALDFDIFDIFFKPTDMMLARRKLAKIIELFSNRNELEKFFNQQMLTISMQGTQIEENQWRIIETLGQALESRDVESGNHCDRMKLVTETFLKYISVTYPRYMLNDVKIREIAKVTPLHDIGKIAIPDRILLKPESAGRLTAEEFEIMKTHTVAGCKIIDSIPNFKNTELYRFSYNICRHHHERWDGKGYPDHLKGMEIPIEAQVVALADVFDALISKRVYKPAFTIERVKEMITGGECGTFNPDLLQCFNHCVDDIYERVYAHNFEE